MEEIENQMEIISIQKVKRIWHSNLFQFSRIRVTKKENRNSEFDLRYAAKLPQEEQEKFFNELVVE